MDVSEKAIRSNYISMNLHKLEALRENPGITDVSRRILDEVIYSKNKNMMMSRNTIEHAYNAINSGLVRGVEINTTLKELSLQGVSPAVLNGAIDKIRADIGESQRSPVNSNLIVGGILLAAGAGISGYTYFIATQEGSRYLMMWGLILVGGVMLIQGLYQYLKEVFNR